MKADKDKRDLGEMGENTLQLWASQVGITANPAKRDKEGWDYLLQLPPSDLQSDSPLDLRPGEINCLLQVKATRTKTKRISVKLSNWEKFVKIQLPAFFLVLRYGNGLDIEEAYLIHVGKDWIERVLNKLRKIDPNKKDHLNKQSLDLVWSLENRLQNLNGEGLEEPIRKHVGLRTDDYSKKKIEMIENAGDPLKGRIQLTTKHLSEEDMWKDWIDFALGLRDGMETVGMVVEEDIRFDIPARSKKYETEGWFKFDIPPSKDVKLEIKNIQGPLVSTFPAKVITPHYIFPGTDIPEKYFRARVIFQHGDLIFHPYSKTGILNVQFIIEDKIETLGSIDTLKNLANSWRLAFILDDVKSKGCEIDISDDIGTSMKIQVFSEQNISEQILGFAASAECAWYIARYFDLPIETYSSVIQLSLQFYTLRYLREILDANAHIEVFQFDTNEDKLILGETYTVIFGQLIHFNQMEVLIRMALRGVLSLNQRTNESFEHFHVNTPARIHADYRKLNDSSIVSINEFLDELGREFENKGHKVILIKSVAR